MSQIGFFNGNGGGGGGTVTTLTGNAGGAVPPTGGNINVIGSGDITVTGNPGTSTLTITSSAAGGTNEFDTDSGNAAPSSGVINILGGTNINTAGAGSTVTINLDAVPSVSEITITNPPTVGTDGANKAYVDAVASGLDFKDSCFAATTANLAATYNNGVAGVGATLTNSGAMAVFSVDGVSPVVNSRILVKNQGSQLENGIYDLTTVGSGLTNWVLTRSTDYDSPTEITPGDLVPVTNGTVNAGTFWVETATVTTVGVDSIIFSQFFGGGIHTIMTSSGNATASNGNITFADGNNITVSAAASTVTFDVSGTTNHALQLGNASGSLTSLGVATDGQLPIGSTGVDPVLATLTPGTNISIANGAGSITINATGAASFAWSVITLDQTAAVNNGYICNKAGTLALLLPAVSIVGDVIRVTGINNATGWQITQAAGQQVFFGATQTTLGATGTLTSSATRDALEIVCIAANTTWQVLSSIGNITVV